MPSPRAVSWSLRCMPIRWMTSYARPRRHERPGRLATINADSPESLIAEIRGRKPRRRL
jgi:hypothetical protein